MLLLKKSEVSKMTGAPSAPALTDKQKMNPRPTYFVEQDGKIFIDVQSSAWVEAMRKRISILATGRRKGGGEITDSEKKLVAYYKETGRVVMPEDIEVIRNKKEKTSKQQSDSPKKTKRKYKPAETQATSDLSALEEAAVRAKLEKEVSQARLAEYKAEQEKLKLEQEAGRLVTKDLAAFLYTGYMDRMNRELLSITKKLGPIIENLCTENEPDRLMKMLNKEFKRLLEEIKKDQLTDLKKWEREK